MTPEPTTKKWTAQATEKVLSALNRADEIGGEVRDYIQDKMATDPRYIKARKAFAKLLGKSYESRAEVEAKAKAAEAKRAAAAAPTPPTTKQKEAARTGFGNPELKAQIYGKKSCPWTGRAITLLERHKLDYDYIDLEEPEHEAKLVPLSNETKQHTVPFIYLRGQFVGGYNSLAEIERLGQLEYALMSKEERAAAPAHMKNIEIVARPNTDEVAPADQTPGE
ncbi:MAG: glutaredoxin [Kofleriaceae bacterium]|nr:glutaredoxin [Kofleriaceae bacterium]